jgi:haloalkane dehalogenase
MRKLLGVTPEVNFVHPRITADITLRIFRDYDFLTPEPMGLITSGFGCPHACDFCSTSAYFGYRAVSFLQDGEAMYEAMKGQCRESGGRTSNFLIFEEDMMLFKRKVEEMGQLIEHDTQDMLSYACFATIKALSRWDLEQLVAGGFGHVWIGVESMTIPYVKAEGRDMKELFDELRSYGVTTTGSMIFGLDHHTPEMLGPEAAYLASLYPSTAQFGNLIPATGTEVRKRLEEEGRINNFDYRESDLFSEVVTHPAFKPGDLKKATFKAYEDLYEAIGPSVHRILSTWFSGYKKLRSHARPALRRRAELYASRVLRLRPLFLETGSYLPNDEIRRQVRETLAEIKAELGPPTVDDLGRAELYRHVFALEEAKRRHLKPEVREPSLTVKDYMPAVMPMNAPSIGLPVLS